MLNLEQLTAVRQVVFQFLIYPFDFRFISQTMFFDGFVKFNAAFVKKIENFGNFIGSQSDVSIISFLIFKPLILIKTMAFSVFCNEYLLKV